MNIEAKTENLPEIYPITPSDFSIEKNIKQLDKINFFQYRRKNTDKKIVKNDLAFLKKSLKVILNSCH